MEDNNIGQRVQHIFCRVFKLKPEEVNEDLSSENLPQWDSLRHIQLIMAIEEAFSIQLPTWEIPKLTSIRAISTFLVKLAAH